MLKLIARNTGLLPDILHLGCGSDIMENAVNIDTNINFSSYLTETKSNVVIYEGDINGPQDLPKKHFSRVEAHMVLEHIHQDLIPNLLYCLCNFLQDNGVLVATVPNFGYLAERIHRASDWSCVPNVISLQSFREAVNEFLCPNMCGMVGHQSVWVKAVATMWLNAEGFALVDWAESENKMHVTFRAVKIGGDHVSPV